ncbi:MAG: hypothetical protein ABIA92_03695 [Patescibacteria group bacterium]
MAFETPDWVAKIKRPKPEALGPAKDTLLAGFKTALKAQPENAHDDETVDSLQVSDLRIIIDEKKRNEELGFVVAATKQTQVAVRHLGIIPGKKKVPKILLNETIGEPESLRLLEELTQEQRVMLANTITPVFCETWENISQQEATRIAKAKADKEDGLEEEPQGQIAKKSDRMAKRVRTKDLGKVYRRVTGVPA